MNYKEIKKYNKNNVKVLSGIPAAPGYAIGKVLIYVREKVSVSKSVVLNTEAEYNNFIYALEKSKKEISKIISTSKIKIGDEHAKLFEAHLLVLEDEFILKPIINNIKVNRFSADYAIEKEFSKYIEQLKKSDDFNSKERAAELEDVKARLIRNLNRKRWESKLKDSVIIAAHNLTPADTLMLSRNNVLGYISEIGGLTSHTAIISRSLNIPAVVGVHDVLSELKNDEQIILDGFNGFIIINPDDYLVSYYENKIEKHNQNKKKLTGFKSSVCETCDGRRIYLSANVEFLHEIEIAKTFNCDGIGLYRSESMFFEKGKFPDEAEQIDRYTALAERIFPEKIVIRTFDIGGDKILPDNLEEKNPFLGWRGTRMMLDEIDIFKKQLRSILISSIYKNVRIMFPMISTLEEVIEAKKILNSVKHELIEQKIKFDKSIQIGIMAEIPSIAFNIEDIAKEVDFISLGTNDLIQYTLAVDRGNDIVSKYYQEYNPAVIRIIKQITEGAKKNNLKVSICGEMGSEVKLVPLLLGIGIDELSVNVHSILEIKKYLKNFNLDELEKIASDCLNMKFEKEIEKYLNNIYNKKIGV